MKIKILSVMSLLFLVLCFYKYEVEKTHKEDIKSFQEYAKQADMLIVLQNKWNNKKEDKKLLKDINKRFNPTSYTVEKDIHILIFDDLTKSTLNRLGKMLLNSNLIFQNIDLRRKGKKISLHVEVKI
ncbi:MAG TPA: hypothetical protein EYG93_03110 [Sulfurospirillum arcachonense]|nr:hypothetical protein [Sulfurospirillum arcachonense]HIP44311.1 hypothetical protein [Sulfurospirillum arcachonense]